MPWCLSLGIWMIFDNTTTPGVFNITAAEKYQVNVNAAKQCGLIEPDVDSYED